MSFIPTNPSAATAYAALVKEDRPWPGYVYPSDINMEALREVLIAIVCPIPCVGFVNDEGWHKLCECYADAALKQLRGNRTQE